MWWQDGVQLKRYERAFELIVQLRDLEPNNMMFQEYETNLKLLIDGPEETKEEEEDEEEADRDNEDGEDSDEDTDGSGSSDDESADDESNADADDENNGDNEGGDTQALGPESDCKTNMPGANATLGSVETLLPVCKSKVTSADHPQKSTEASSNSTNSPC